MWTETDKEKIRKLYGTLPNKEVAELLGKSEGIIRRYAWRTGLSGNRAERVDSREPYLHEYTTWKYLTRRER